MESDREAILSKIRQAVQALPAPADYPSYDAREALKRPVPGEGEMRELFQRRLEEAHGIFMDSPAALASWLRAKEAFRGFCDPELWPALEAQFPSPFQIDAGPFQRAEVDTYAFGVTRAAGAIADTGSLILTEASTASRLASLAPWIHIAVVEEQTLFPDLPAALAALGRDPNVVWVTGPSKTADVEGILIEGMHGPGIQIALLVRRH